MALKRATKSIPLSGGIIEETDDFLLEPAGMQYMENVQFTKKDMAEKAEPVSLLAVTGGANHTVNAYGMWSKGDSVAIVENNAILVSDDAGATWDQQFQDTDLLGMEKILSSAEASGGFNFCCAPIGTFTPAPRGFVISLYGVAYERMTQNTSVTNGTTRDVVAATYDLDGRLITEKVITGHCSPIMRWDDSGATLMMVDTANGDIRVELASEASRAFQFLGDFAEDVQLYHQMYNNTNDGYGPVGTELLGEDMRLGFSVDHRYGNAALAMYMDIESSAGAMAWKEEATGSIFWRELLNGSPTGVNQGIVADAVNVHFAILDVATDATNVYLLISRTDTSLTAAQTSVRVYAEPLGGGAITTFNFAPTVEGLIINGSIRPQTLAGFTDDLFVAYTIAAEEPDTFPNTTLGNHRVSWAYITGPVGSGVVSQSGDVYSHRLVSNIVALKSGLFAGVVQQWDNYNPDSGTVGSNPAIPALALAHKKPVTSILMKFDYVNSDMEPFASIDAGQSKHMLPGSEEQNTLLQNLYYFDQGIGQVGAHQFWYGNRNILTAEDDWYYIANSAANTPWPENDGKVPLHPGSARLNMYRLQSSIRVPFTLFPRGMFMGTSLPSWFDGSNTLSSITALESPEIVGADMDGNGGTYLAYQDLAVTNESPTLVQAVAGYYDDAGHIHRSAPSVPVYIGKAIATAPTSSTAIWTKVWVTPPLTLTKERNYFLEIYEALPGEVPSLAATKHFPNGNAAGPVDISWATNLDPTTAANRINVTPFRGAKAIYTAGNVLAADPWPNFDMVAKSGRRLFAHSIQDASTIFYSKTFENGISPEFSASLTISIGNEEITAMGAIDDKVIVWTRCEMWLIYGTGPDNTGANGDFFVEKFPHQIGCDDPDSVIQYEDGIAFYSNSTKEFHLVSRDLQVQDIGEAVKDITANSGFNVLRALVYPEAHEVRWYSELTAVPNQNLAVGGETGVTQPPRPWLLSQPPANSILTYNFKYGKWSVIDDGVDSTHIVGLVNGKPAGLKNWNFYSTSTDWFDADLTTQETPWIKVNQLQDFGRFYGATFLGRYLSSWTDNGSGVESGDIQVTVRYDYESDTEGTPEIHRFRAQRINPTDGNRLQFEVQVKRQKCQALKFIIEEVPTTAIEVWEPTYATGRGFILSAVDLYYGAKGGSSRQSAARKN